MVSQSASIPSVVISRSTAPSVTTPPSERIVVTFNNSGALQEQMLRFDVGTSRPAGVTVINDVRTTVSVGSIRNAGSHTSDGPTVTSLLEQMNRARMAGYLAGRFAARNNAERIGQPEAAGPSPRSLAASIIRGSRSPNGGS